MHHRYVLTYVIEKPGKVFLDGAAVSLEEGEALLVAPYQYHDYYEMDEERLRWLFITFEVVQGGSFLSELRNRPLRPDDVARSLWVELAGLWGSDVQSDERRSEILPTLERLLMRLKSYGKIALPRPQSEREDAGEMGDEWTSRVEELIVRSVYENWSLEEVARRANISLRYLRSRFEKVMGVAPSEFRANYQLHAAMLLMRDSRLSLSQVAERSGFGSLPVFSRFVKRRVGLAPSQLRKKLLRGEFKFEVPTR